MARVRNVPALPQSAFLTDPGKYLVKVTKVDDSDPDYYEFVFEVIAGDHAGQTIKMRNYLSKESLWALRRTLEALGFKVPESAFRIDLDALVGRKCVVVCKLKADRKDPTKEYNNIVGMALASTWDGEQPKGSPSSTANMVRGDAPAAPAQAKEDDEDDTDEEVPDVLSGPKGA